MLAAATWRALRKALFPHQRTELRKGKILQRLSHLEWFGVAIQLSGSQSLSELLQIFKGFKSANSPTPMRVNAEDPAGGDALEPEAGLS